MPNRTETIKKMGWRRTAARVAVAVTMAVPVVLVGAQAADASWTLQSPPVPSGSISSDLEDVSCTTGSSCVGVGNVELSGSVFETFADAWNGSTWTLDTTPNPTISDLDGVSCPQVGACVAVGDIVQSGGKIVPLAERSTGSTWTAMSMPVPSGTSRSIMISVYCGSPTKCTSVGVYYDSSGNEFTFAETLNGSTWTLHTTPDPAGATTSQLNKVACIHPDSCIAVGYYLSPSYTLLAESWNGTSWSIMTTPLPSGGTDGLFEGVSCGAATACFAVGSYAVGPQLYALSEIWNGTTWTPQATAPLTTAKAAGLAGVSCRSASNCTAVGYLRKHREDLTLAEKWNGTSWKYQSTAPVPGAIGSSLAAVSCRSKIYCTAVGYYEGTSGEDFALAEQYS